jgi:site-specific DNA recombinase
VILYKKEVIDLKKVRIIPARYIEEINIEKRKLRVAAYCRVSTCYEEQLERYEAQVNRYKYYIKNNSSWELIGVYGDLGKSALRIDERYEFKKLIHLAKNGEVDLIITKSITRFSRNTVNTLEIIRDLRERNVGVMFENEKINTLDKESELYMEIMSAFAQEQSRNISEDIKWGYRAKFKRGDIFTKYKNFMGYTCENDEIVIVEEEASIVHKIFEIYLDGKSLKQIKEYLEENQIKTATGKEIWHINTIDKMLSNEKYMGDTLLQKTCSVDFLSKKRLKNDGIVGSYYIEDTHPAIVSKEIFNKVQEEKKRRARLIKKSDGTVEVSKNKYNSKYLLGNLLVCAHCGASFRRRTERGKVVWRCATRVEKGRDECNQSPTLKEEDVKKAIFKFIGIEGVFDEHKINEAIKSIEVKDLKDLKFEKRG